MWRIHEHDDNLVHDLATTWRHAARGQGTMQYALIVEALSTTETHG